MHQHINQHSSAGTEHRLYPNCMFNRPLYFLLGQLQSHKNSFPLILQPLSYLRRAFTLTWLETFWISKCTEWSRSPSATIFLAWPLSHNSSRELVGPCSPIISYLSEFHYPTFKYHFKLISPGQLWRMSCNSLNYTLRLFEYIYASFPISQSLHTVGPADLSGVFQP